MVSPEHVALFLCLLDCVFVQLFFDRILEENEMRADSHEYNWHMGLMRSERLSCQHPLSPSQARVTLCVTVSMGLCLICLPLCVCVCECVCARPCVSPLQVIVFWVSPE